MAPTRAAPIKTHRQKSRSGLHSATSIAKPKQASGTRKGLRSQNKKPVSHASSPPLARSSPICSAPISQTVRAKRKRPQDCEAKAERPTKNPRRNPPPRLELFGEDLEQDSEAKAKADDLEPPSLSEESEEDIQTL